VEYVTESPPMPPSPPAAPRRSGLAAGILLMTLATYVAYAVGLASNAFIARGLTPVDFGRYSFVVWLSGWLVLTINNGLTTTGIRFISELVGGGSVESARRTHGYLLRLSRYFEVAVLASTALVLWIISPEDWAGAVPLFIGVVLVSAYTKARYLFDISVAKGYAQFKVEAWCTITVSLLTAVALAALFLLRAAFSAYLLLFAISSIGYLLMASLQLRALGLAPAAERPEPQVLERLLPHLRWTTLLTAVAIFGNKSVEVFILNVTGEPQDVGFFTIGAALTRGGLDLLISGLMTVLLPVMSNAFGRGGQSEVQRIFHDSVRYFAFAGLLAAGAGYFLAAPTIELLYGQGYLRAIPAFQAMVLATGLTLGEASFGALLSTTDRQRSRALLVAGQIGITVVFAAVLIPLYGFYGAIAAHVASRLLGFLLMTVSVRRMYSTPLPVTQWMRLMMAAIIAGVAALAWGELVPGVIGQCVAALLYAAVLIPATLVLRCWNDTDFALIERLLERHLPRSRGTRQLIARIRGRFGSKS
jgi:O-antigen/teichoic acid export membrane protein